MYSIPSDQNPDHPLSRSGKAGAVKSTAPTMNFARRSKVYIGPPLAMSIVEFCALHDLSREMFFKLKRQGLGPAEMRHARAGDVV